MSVLFHHQFSPVGDGIADDTRKLRLAIDWCRAYGESELVIEGGRTYHVTDSFTIDFNLRIRGEGVRSAIFQSNPAKDIFRFIAKPVSSSNQNIKLSGLNLTVAGALATGGSALHFDPEGNHNFFDQIVVEDCLLTGGRAGVFGSRISNARFVGVTVEDAWNNFEFGGSNNNVLRFDNCWSGRAKNFCFYSNASGSAIIATQFEMGGADDYGVPSGPAIFIAGQGFDQTGGNIESCRPTPLGGIVEVGQNGTYSAREVRFVAGNFPNATPIVYGGANLGGCLVDVTNPNYAHDTIAKTYRNRLPSLRFSGSGHVECHTTADLSDADPVCFGALEQATYHQNDFANIEPTEALCGLTVATYSDSNDGTEDKRYLCRKNGLNSYEWKRLV